MLTGEQYVNIRAFQTTMSFLYKNVPVFIPEAQKVEGTRVQTGFFKILL
jgi:hypothetical protein